MPLDKILKCSFFVLIFSLGFMQPSFLVVSYEVPYTDPIFLFVFLIWFFALLFRKAKLRFSFFYLPLVFYFLAVACSTIFSIEPKISFFKLSGEMYLIGLAVLTFNLVDSVEMTKKTILVWLAGTFAACFVSVLTLTLFYIDRTNPLLTFTLSHFGTLPPGNYARIRGSFQNANMLCDYLNVSLMFVLAAFRLDWINKRTFAIFLVFFAVAVFFTLSPGLGGILLCAGLWMRLIFQENNFSSLARISLVGGIASASVFFIMLLFLPNANPLSPYYFNLPFFDRPVYPSERLLAWQGTLEAFWKEPVFGHGLGIDVINIRSIIASGNIHIVSDAHQLWLSVAGQSGILGLAAILTVTIVFLRKTLPWTLGKEPISVLRVCFGLAFLGAFIYQGLGGSYEDARHLWVLIGLIGSISELRTLVTD